MLIFKKWQSLLAAMGPQVTGPEREEARRLFYAGATAAFEVLVKDTDGLAIETQVSLIKDVESELVQHRNELVTMRKRKIN